uniref:NADH-ubiquinone oxidoreductase chain 4 n=1 Tax=Ornebius bimaculatus TaxID=2153490 RepID=A0A385I202_9ORTH|nr:NADH dehydrogenase subunit 4 [Ornebius bimaculatus]AXY63932.1 NADH dehydrogenase subunit 4 [Ornebius bimaculatus]
MLKYMLMLLFLILYFFFYGMEWWLVQLLLLFMTFLFFSSIGLNLEDSSLGYGLGIDNLSFGMILLSIWICSLMLMASNMIYTNNVNVNLFIILLMMMMVFLMLTFSSTSMLYFYLFFESSLIPTVLLIFGWGYQPERLEAGMYLLFYTLLLSLPLLVALLKIFQENCSLTFLLLNFDNMNIYMYISLIMAFLVKMPMFIVHLWLPKAHVEAPVAGSMILAGVLLKLGGYGLLRVMKLIVCLGISYNYLFMSISLVGGVMVSLICMRQVDLKSLIAYSSVAHMSIVLGGIFTLMNWGMQGSYTLMLGHGLCSSGLFYLANVVYERLGSRSLLINKGIMNFMPSMTMCWFMLISSNMAAPPSLNLMGEICLLNSLVSWSIISMILLMMLSFFSASYSLYLYSSIHHGKMYSGMYSCSSGFFRDYMVVFLHWLPLNLLILSGDFWLMMF